MFKKIPLKSCTPSQPDITTGDIIVLGILKLKTERVHRNILALKPEIINSVPYQHAQFHVCYL